MAAGLVIGSSEFSPADAASLGSYTFSGSVSGSGGGTVSATMDFDLSASNTLTVSLNNTSDHTQEVDPAITAFGFDGSKVAYSSWYLEAHDSNGNPQTIGSSNPTECGSTCFWDLGYTDGEGENLSSFRLNYLADTDPGINGALYNPAANPSTFGPNPYFTNANLVVNFSNSGFTLGDDLAVKFQRIGTDDNSLTVPGQPIPEPASMLGIMAFGALGGGRLLRKKKQQAAQG